MDQQIEAAAEAICAVTGAGRMFPWDTLNEGERDAWREMARAAIQALGLTTHWGVGTLDESDNLIDVNANLFHSPEDARKGMQELRLMYGKRRCLVSRFGQSPWVVVEHPQDGDPEKEKDTFCIGCLVDSQSHTCGFAMTSPVPDRWKGAAGSER